MGAEVGATTSTFGYDAAMRRYLIATKREDISRLADNISEHLNGDDEVYKNPKKAIKFLTIAQKALRKIT